MTVASRCSLDMLPSFYDNIYDLERAEKRFQVFYGGAGSGKSYSVAQHIVSLALEHDDLEILAVRKTRPVVKLSCLKFIKNVLASLDVEYVLNRSDLEMTVGNSTIFFKGLDEPEKLKSVEFNIVWMEEATEFMPADFKFLNMRCRRPHDVVRGQLFLTFNPVTAANWAVRRFVVERDPAAAIMHSTWRDNPFLSQIDVQQLLDYESTDANFYKVYALGQPGVLKGLIYDRWETEDVVTFPERNPDSMGLDLGHTNPTVLVAIWRGEETLHIRELLYERGLSTSALLARLETLLVEKVPEGETRRPRWDWRAVPIYADPSRPEIIQDIHDAGYNCHKANNKVMDGINYVKSFNQIVDSESLNLQEEMNRYRWREDKEGNPLDEPVKQDDHGMDGVRYGAFSDRPPLVRRGVVPEAMFGGYGGDALRGALGEQKRVDPYWGDL